MRFSRSIPVCLLLVSILACSVAAQEVVEVKIGDVFPANQSTPHPYPPRIDEDQPVWSAPIYHPGGSLIKVHLNNFDLAPGDYVVIRDVKGKEVDRITAKEANPLGEIWALSVPGDLVVVELWAGAKGGKRYGFDIDRYARFWDLSSLPMAESTCLSNDRERIACYKNSPTKPASVYQHARAACGMANVNATATFCTGALASRDGLFFTCNHCVSSQSKANSLEVWFDYEHSSCSGGSVIPGIRIRGPHQMVWTSSCNDSSMIRLHPSGVNPNGTDVPGSHDYLLNEPGPLTLNEPCWIPGHPAGNPKEVSFQGNPAPQVTVPAKVIQCSPAQNFFGHTADTTGGSSGSTVLNRNNRRIGVHGYGGCRTSQPVGSNGAARMDLIWPQVQQHYMDWNQTLRMVPDGDDRSTPVGNGTDIPFGIAEARTQTLILAADIGRKGLIQDIALASTSLTTIHIARLQVRMAHRAAVTLSSNFATNLTRDARVVFDGPLTWNVVNDGWVKIGLKVPFDFNGEDNLVVEYRVQGLTGGTLFHSAWKGGLAAKPIRNFAQGSGSFNATTATTTNEPAGMKHRIYFAYRPRVVTVPGPDPVTADPGGIPFKSGEVRYQWFIPRDSVAAHGNIVGLTWPGSETGLLRAANLQVRVAATTATFSSGFDANISGATTVFSSATSELRLVKGQWHGLPFSAPFPYDGTRNLVVEVRYQSGSGGALSYRNTSTSSGVQRAYGTGSGAYNSTIATGVDHRAAGIRFVFSNATRVIPGTARVGQIMTLVWSAPDFKSTAYLGAATFDTSPGIPLPGEDARILQMNADNLFFFSRFNPATFLGFSGILNTTGTASGMIFIPNLPALAGIQFYLAMVVVDPSPGVPNAIPDFSDGARVVIQP